MLARLRSWTIGALRRDRVEDEMDAEIRFHVAQHVDDLVARGVPRAEAERQARAAFGRLDTVKDACRQARALDAIDALRRDVRYAWRMLRRSPGFAITVIATLALCIGANTAIFSVVDAVLFRPLPYPHPERLALLMTYYSDARHEGEFWGTSQNGATWEMLRDGATPVDWAAYSGSARLNLVAGRSVEYVAQQRVTAGYFSVVGAPPAIGRQFTRDEDRPGGAPVVILSHALWQRLFNGTWPIRTSLLLRGEPYAVVGVMPPGFITSMHADVWTPLQPSRTGEGSGENYTIIGRLKAGTGWPAATDSLAGVGRAITADLRTTGMRARLALTGLQSAETMSVRRPLLILLAGVVIVLLIGCLNVAGLLVARSLERTPEIATRIALGCGRSGVVRQLVVESLVLALLGGIAAVAVARLAIGWLGGIMPSLGDEFLQSTYGIWQPIRLDGRVLLVTALVAVMTSVLFGLTPALQALRLDIRAGLTSGGGRAVARAVTRWPRRLLVVAQIALGVVLLTDAGLLLRSFAHLAAGGPSLDARNTITATLPLQDVRYSTMASVNRLFDRTLTAIKALPGVESAAVTLSLPYERGLNLPFRRTGDAHNQMTVLTYVTPDFFHTLRIPLRRGRTFDEHDAAGSRAVVAVNEAFAGTYFHGRDPLLEQVRLLGRALPIVGVVGNVRQKASFGNYEPVDALPVAYIPASQVPDSLARVHVWFSPSWLVRTTAPDPTLVSNLERIMASIDAHTPFASFRKIEDVKSRVLAPERFQAMVLGGFSGLAVLLVALGLYGLVAKSVAERTRELGIRLALGASVGRAMRAIALPAVTLAAVGIAGGAALAGVSARLLRNQIWGVNENDPTSLAGAAFGLLLLAFAVSFAATWRIARLDPADTLRQE
jgi:predicted permease